jgi:hypothetical protein
MQTPWIAHAYTARTPGTRPNAHAMPTSTSTCIAYACTCGGDQSAERLAADGARLAAPLQLLGAASAAAGVATTEDHSAGGVETDDAYFAGLRGGRSALLRRPLGRRPLRHFCRLHHSRPLCRRRPLRRRPLPLLCIALPQEPRQLSRLSLLPLLRRALPLLRCRPFRCRRPLRCRPFRCRRPLRCHPLRCRALRCRALRCRPLRCRPLPLLRRRALRCRLRRRPLLLTLQSHMHVHVSVCWRWKG